MQDKEIQGPQQQAKRWFVSCEEKTNSWISSFLLWKCTADEAHSITHNPHTSWSGKHKSESQRRKGGEEIARSKWPPGEVWLLDMLKALLDGLEVVGAEWKGEGAQKLSKRRGCKLESPSWSFTEQAATLPGCNLREGKGVRIQPAKHKRKGVWCRG